MANNSLEDKNVKMLLVVVVVGLVIYLLVSYLNGGSICGNQNEGFHQPSAADYPSPSHNDKYVDDTWVNSVNHSKEEPNDNNEVKVNEFNEIDREDEVNNVAVANNNAVTNNVFEENEVSEGFENPQPSNPNNSTEAEVAYSNNSNPSNLPAECYPKDVLSSQDLLPADANSKFAQVNPNGQGSLGDKNFLTAGFHVGVNTVGQSLRNANRQLRSDPPNPQVKVSPWMQTTIEPDVNRKPLEIGQ